MVIIVVIIIIVIYWLGVRPLWLTFSAHAQEGLILVDRQRRIRWTNAATKKMIPDDAIRKMLFSDGVDCAQIRHFNVGDRVIAMRCAGWRWGTLILLSDVTALVNAEHDLYAAQTRYDQVMNTMSEGVVLQTADGTIQACNPAAERILGLSADQMMGLKSIDPQWRAVHEDFSPFPGETHPAMVTLATGQPQYDVIMGVHKPDDTLTWINVNARPLTRPDAEKPYAVLATFIDITAKREASLRAFESALERERLILLTDFIRDAVHEFRTPLATINSSAYLMNHMTDTAQKAEKLTIINEQVTRLTKLIEKLVKMAQLDNITIDFKPIDLRALLLDVHVNAITYARVTINMPEDIPPILGDKVLLREVLFSLLDNAERFSPPDSPIRVDVTLTDHHVTLAVCDKGIGIAADKLDEIFKIFWRADRAHTTPGMGLGLPLARRVVELHNGKLYVESEVGSGSCFYVQLPITS